MWWAWLAWYPATTRKEWSLWHNEDTPQQKEPKRAKDEPESDDSWIVEAYHAGPKEKPTGKKIKKSDEYYHDLPWVWQRYPANLYEGKSTTTTVPKSTSIAEVV